MKNNARRLGGSIHRLDVSIGRRLCQELQQQPGMEELSGTNGRIIRFLSDHEDRDVYQRDLEKEFGITRSTASRVLMLMEQKELITRRGVEHDARLKKVTLTDKSRKLSDFMRQCGHALDERLLAGFSAEETDQLFCFLDRMQTNLAGQ